MHPATDFAISKVQIIIILITEKREKSERHVRKIEEKTAFFLHTILYSCVEENGGCGIRLLGRVECTLWKTVWKRVFPALGSCDVVSVVRSLFCLCVPCFLP